VNEFNLIERFVAPFGVRASPGGPGDDAAVLPASPTSVVTCDAVVEGVHFLRDTFSMRDIGHKALAVNLSDLAAMGATPSWFLCALGLPRDLGVKDLDELAGGMAELARAHHIELVGGNVTRAPELSVTITAAGTARRPLLRSGGAPGHHLYVSGFLGQAAAGLELLQKHAAIGRGQRPLVDAQRRPAPHLAFGQLASGFASAAIDISDGLLQDLGHLAAASGVGASLESTAVPVSDELFAYAGSRGKALELALRGGEDYVLLVAVPPRRRAAFERALGQAGLAALRIGHLTEERAVIVDGRPPRRSAGFLHFR
jgi:thiamine-monophosphate kinase